MTEKIRDDSHAGSWYTSNPSQLEEQLEGWLSKAKLKDNKTKAIISPHAGYKYSGESAAYSFKQLVPSNVTRIFVLGPSHHYYLKGCALPELTHYKTPFGNIQLDLKVIKELRETKEFSTMSRDVDEDEHSIEMQLPYIYHMMKGKKYTLVPILVGQIGKNNGASFAKIFKRYLDDSENFFVISSDFCHWGKRFSYMYYDDKHGEIYQSIEHLDKLGMNAIESCNPDTFSSYLDKYSNTICGRNPIKLLLETVQSSDYKDKLKIEFLYYAQSSRCKNSSDSSVSYAAGRLYLSP
eukprot:TRINITY_DN6972_c0_g1_i2.p1 TRINITY_DN6972_c0_g1~~TRINITY_DN6972_c0_g1_i2.p1  ORF type:complete len:313 (-),score=47.74 TRINITY_DN6972_c0_g1_i2:16-897(-)